MVKVEMSILGGGFVFFLGLSVGSFLNVLIERLPKEEQVFFGRSYCDYCHHQLTWYDLIPLVSFAILGGRCRYCQQKIPLQYPLVELITGGLFVLIASGAPGSKVVQTTELKNLSVICYLFFVISCLIVIFFTDLKYGIIPDRIVFPAVVLTGLFHLAEVFPLANSFTPGESKPTPGVFPWLALGHLGGVLLSGLTAAGFFLLLVFFTRGKGMGLGDVKLAFLMGLFLGFPKVLVALYLAFLTGAFVSVILILTKKKKFGQTIPFGPFLVAGVTFSLFLGEEIVKLWMKVVM